MVEVQGLNQLREGGEACLTPELKLSNGRLRVPACFLMLPAIAFCTAHILAMVVINAANTQIIMQLFVAALCCNHIHHASGSAQEEL
jgi:hypothetical protein